MDSSSSSSSSPNPRFAGNHKDNTQKNSGLLRFGSAPSSFLESFIARQEPAGSRFINGVSGLPPQYPTPPPPRPSSGSLFPAAAASNLTRQNSSPPGILPNLTPLNGYPTMKSPLSYSSLGILSQITEVENESIMGSVLDDDEKGGNAISDPPQLYGSGLQFPSWSDSPSFAEKLNNLKRELEDDDDNDVNLFAAAAASTQVGGIGGGAKPTKLSRHLSSPKTSTEIAAAMEFTDSVPWNIRAKRGCATHPRSIAERVRRTRISERMRKLQDLVPNMDKQTNTADMLDFAVEYIKDLQRQYKTLTVDRERCKCSASDKKSE
ncbi:unnamed protein product [Cuscuta campestris]|uniref:BHLH domain-containing protein n=1 Tax=Cuscuta campestris TaxID=132261 RepID=A0A484K697_9ASTE|nr:unnamed protein product [Cuscuta campestris]